MENNYQQGPVRQPNYGAPSPRKKDYTHILVAAMIFLAGIFVGYGLEGNMLRWWADHNDSTNLPGQLDFSSVDEVYDQLRTNFDGELSYEELLDGMKQGMARATGDPYTEFLNLEDSQSFEEDLSGTFSGIGAELGIEDDAIIIVAPLSGFPAEEAGLRPRDIIIEIDGESARGISITEAVNQIRGPVGTDVSLLLLRNNEQIEVTITRETISIPSVEYELRDDNIGYLKISRFGEDTVGLVRDAANEFDAANVDGIVVDLRSNPGGILQASIAIADLWLSEGVVIAEQRRGDEVVEQFRAESSDKLGDIPVVLLLNQGSASASEILAGALRDNGIGTIVGMESFGKGSVQQVIPLRSGGTLKVTVGRWYTPDGRNIDKDGIDPDIEVDFTEEDFDNDRDPQLDRALEEL